MNLLRDSVRTLATRSVARVLGAVSGIVITRELGPHDKGLFVYAAAVVAIVLQFTYGASAAIARQWGREGHDGTSVYTASLIAGGATLLIALAILFGAGTLAPGQRILLAACAVLPFGLFVQLSGGFFLTAGRIAVLNWQTLISQTSVLIASAALLPLFHFGLAGVVVLWVTGQAAAALYSALALRTNVSLFRFHIEHTILRSHLTFAVKAGTLQLATYANQRIDVLIVMFALGPATLGIYSIAISAGELLLIFSKSVATAAYARITTLDPQRSAELTARCARHVILLSAIGAAAGVVIMPFAVPIVYGAAFATASVAFFVLAPGIVLWSAMDVFTVYFTAQRGRPSFLIGVHLVCAATCAALTIGFASSLGLVAGALGTSVAYALGLSVTYFVFARATGDPRALLRVDAEDVRFYSELLRRWRRASTARS
ncbi:MAG: oligosaccharide flippase family protein [Candidatus Velthaea sp.]